MRKGTANDLAQTDMPNHRAQMGAGKNMANLHALPWRDEAEHNDLLDGELK